MMTREHWKNRARRAEADVEKLKMDAEHLQYERDEAREKLAELEVFNAGLKESNLAIFEKLAAVEAPVDSLGDLPSSWPTNEAESAALAESVEPVGLGTFARTAAILIASLSSPPPAEPGLREEDLRRLAIYSVATCDINGGNKRDRPAILLEQAIAALARTPPQKEGNHDH